MNSFLEILAYTVPAIVVFATAYYLLKKLMETQLQEKQLELNKDLISSKLPLKLQAYERLLLFCERIKPSNLVLRLRTPNMTNDELQKSLLIAVQKEYEHNLAQQLYTSKNLWNIITLAKDEVLNQVTGALNGLAPEGNASELSNKISAIENSDPKHPVKLAIHAIKEEAKIILG